MKKFYVLFAFLIIGILGIIVYLSYFITFNKGYKSDIKVKEDTQQVSSSNPEDVITIGLFISTTGINAFSDANSYEGAMLSEDYINDNGGLLGKKIKVKIYDNQSTAIGAKQAAQRAVADNIVAAVGANRSTQTLAIAPVLQEAGIPLITPFSTVDRITEIGDYIFRVCYNDSFQGKTLAKYSLEELKLSTAVILSQIDEEYSMILTEKFTDYYNSNGGQVLWSGCYKSRDMDFAKQLSKIKELQPDIVFIPGYTREFGFIVRQAKNLGIETQFLSGDGVGEQIIEYAGDASNGIILSEHWHRELGYPLTDYIIKSYDKKYNKVLFSSAISLVFDAFLLLNYSIEKANSLDRDMIRDNLADVKDFQGSSGVYTFDKNGDPINKNVVISEIQNGVKILKSIYKPEY